MSYPQKFDWPDWFAAIPRYFKRLVSWFCICVGLTSCLDPDAPGNLVPKTVTEDVTLPQIEVNGTRLHAETFGEARDPLVLVLHGGPGADYRSLLPLRDLASSGYQVVFWDQRGAGLSERHDASSYTLDLVLQDLKAVIEYYTEGSERPVVFIGHSWGAMYATWFINEYGDLNGQIAGAILSEPGAFTKSQLDDYMKRLIGSVRIFGEQLTDAAWQAQFMSPKDHARSDYLSMVEIGATPAESMAADTPEWRKGAVVQSALFSLVEKEGFDWTTQLSAFGAEVLFIRSDLNQSMPLWHQQELAASYPNSRIITMQGVGHEMIWENPEEYLDHARDYLLRIFEGRNQ